MESSDSSHVKHDLKMNKLKEELLQECRVMTSFAFANGKSVDAGQIAALHKDDDKISGPELLPIYNYLMNLVKPASPGTLILFEKNRQSNKRFKFLGPLPIVRQFMGLCIFSLLALILVSLSPNVNAHSIQLSMLQGQGIDQAERLAFLLACASVGASFYALFKMNSYINQGTFNMKYSATYWSRYVLGIVAGVLLSELFVVFISSETSTKAIVDQDGLNEDEMLDSANYLLKPILAILGGFSASLVYRILNRLIEAVESVFKASNSETIRQMQQKMAMDGQENEQRIKSITAQRVMNLKSDLINEGVGAETLDKIDNALGDFVPIVPSANEPSDSTSGTVESTDGVSTVTDLELPQTESLSPPDKQEPIPATEAKKTIPEAEGDEKETTSTSSW